MLWSEVQEVFPNQWTLIEAIKARSQENMRIIDDVAVIDKFADGQAAWDKYEEMHKKHKGREFYPIHTSHSNLEIKEQKWLGIRPAYEV